MNGKHIIFIENLNRPAYIGGAPNALLKVSDVRRKNCCLQTTKKNNWGDSIRF